MEFYKVADRADDRSPNLDTLMRNAMEVTGGLAQVVPLPPSWEMDDSEAGLSLVQLKRGAARRGIRPRRAVSATGREGRYRRRIPPVHGSVRCDLGANHRPAEGIREAHT